MELKQFKNGVVLVIAFCLILSFPSCAGKNQNYAANALEVITTLQSDDSTAAAGLVKNNIVKIENTIDGSSKIVGTGFFDHSGYLVTDSHVVDISGKLKVLYADGSSASAKLVANDIHSDIAILTVDKPKCKAMFFSHTSGLQETHQLFSAGFAYNLDGWATITKGVLSARRFVDDIEYLQTDAPLSPGCSGGPLFDSKANFLGIITLASENASIGMAISAESLRKIIDRLKDSPMIEYVNNTRPANALSSVLVNIGFRIDDIYGEAEILKRKKSQKAVGPQTAGPNREAARQTAAAPAVPSKTTERTVPCRLKSAVIFLRAVSLFRPRESSSKSWMESPNLSSGCKWSEVKP